MLSSVIVGSLGAEVNNVWEITSDKNDGKYISNESIGQKIKLGKGVQPHLEKIKSSANMAVYDINETQEEQQDETSEIYSITQSTFLSNSNINMGLMLLNYYSKSAEDMEAHEDDNVCYITITTGKYKLISYNPFGQTIVSTYMNYGRYQGCAIMHNASCDKIVELILRDLDAKRYVRLTVLRDPATGSITVEKVTKFERLDYEKIKTRATALGDRITQFKVNLRGLPTATYLTPESMYDMVDDLTKDIRNRNILTLADGNESFEYTDPKDIQKLDEYFTDRLKNKRIKALTTVGIRVPKDFCKKYGISYLFDYNVEKGRLFCTRSK